jgi:hypothetical protein
MTIASAASYDPRAIAEEAYIFGYPLVLMDLTKQRATAAPLNRFHHARAFADLAHTAAIAPDVDVLESGAWLDLGREPLVLSLPEIGGRYYAMTMLDAWTNIVASLGTRTTGAGPGTFVIVGPRWTGVLPDRIRPLQVPTQMAWIGGRVQTDRSRDHEVVHRIQDRFRLTPLSNWLSRASSAERRIVAATGAVEDGTTADVIARMDAASYFNRLSALMAANPPASADASLLARTAVIGVTAGRRMASGDALTRACDDGARTGLARIIESARRTHGTVVNGWSTMTSRAELDGHHDGAYLRRAVAALIDLGSPLRADALHQRATTDADGEPLDGSHRYALQFPSGQTPPANAFWSLTLYDHQQKFAANPIDRHALGGRDPLIFNADGSLDLVIQHERPEPGRESNWLPAPSDGFMLLLRIYWPKLAALDGEWVMPPVRRVV